MVGDDITDSRTDIGGETTRKPRNTVKRKYDARIEMQKTGFETSDVIAGGVPKMAAESETCASQMAMDVNDDLEKYGEDISLAKDGGVRKIIKKEGSRKDRPPVGSKVRVYYRGTFLNGEEFDSNVGRKEPFEFEVGKGEITFCCLWKKRKTSVFDAVLRDIR